VDSNRRLEENVVKYQLVLQWPCEAGLDYEGLIKTEELLSEGLASAEIDGHDVGRREMNIFILTNEPLDCFESVKALLVNQRIWTNLRAAYRELTGTKYTILWPKGLGEFVVG
jgi:hypothetical protein